MARRVNTLNCGGVGDFEIINHFNDWADENGSVSKQSFLPVHGPCSNKPDEQGRMQS